MELSLKILVTGGSGQVGTELIQTLKNRPNVIQVVAPTSAEMDLMSRESVLSAISQAQPDWIVHLGAWTQVDACEDDPDKAFRTNALGTRFVVQGARRVGARVCYVSTDYVFSGSSPKPYREWDEVSPNTVYGASKLAGEAEMRPCDLIVRTSWVMGLYGNNMAKTLVRLARAGDEHRFVDDQIGIPTVVSDLVEVLSDLVELGHSGIFHVSNSEATTWYEVARFVFEVMGEDPNRISPAKTAELTGYKAPRPHYSVLDNFALRYSGLTELPPWHESLSKLVAKLSEQS